jgi:hypothetical protein
MNNAEHKSRMRSAGSKAPGFGACHASVEFLTLTVDFNRRCVAAGLQLFLWSWGVRPAPSAFGGTAEVVQPSFGHVPIRRQFGTAEVIPFPTAASRRRRMYRP